MTGHAELPMRSGRFGWICLMDGTAAMAVKSR
jgi:hypothetical protein